MKTGLQLTQIRALPCWIISSIRKILPHSLQIASLALTVADIMGGAAISGPVSEDFNSDLTWL